MTKFYFSLFTFNSFVFLCLFILLSHFQIIVGLSLIHWFIAIFGFSFFHVCFFYLVYGYEY